MSCECKYKSENEQFRDALQILGNMPIPELFRRLGWFMAIHVCLVFVSLYGLLILGACIGVQAMLGYI